MEIIAHIHTEFPDKFGIPRQSGLVPSLEGRVVFTPGFRSPEALRGLEQFSHIWLLWKFSAVDSGKWSPTVRPPRLGGNTRTGVFATRSPFRPNGIGLSSVRLERIDYTGSDAPSLIVSGADLMDGTPVYDIKPYIPFTDCHPDASGGYTEQTKTHRLEVICPPELLSVYSSRMSDALLGVLGQDPRPAYIDDPSRIYGLSFGGFDVRFQVEGSRLTVVSIKKI